MAIVPPVGTATGLVGRLVLHPHELGVDVGLLDRRQARLDSVRRSGQAGAMFRTFPPSNGASS